MRAVKHPAERAPRCKVSDRGNAERQTEPCLAPSQQPPQSCGDNVVSKLGVCHDFVCALLAQQYVEDALALSAHVCARWASFIDLSDIRLFKAFDRRDGVRLRETYVTKGADRRADQIQRCRSRT